MPEHLRPNITRQPITALVAFLSIFVFYTILPQEFRQILIFKSNLQMLSCYYSQIDLDSDILWAID